LEILGVAHRCAGLVQMEPLAAIAGIVGDGAAPEHHGRVAGAVDVAELREIVVGQEISLPIG
jgi:hypothetical protein